MTTRKKAGTSLTKWEEEMAAAAQKQSAAEKDVGGDFSSISTRSGILSVDDTALPNNELRAVILMSVHENQYFESDFDPNVITIPACYAFAGEDDDEDEMAPHAEASNPQNDKCDGCDLNEFGSAERGRGKACKNIRRLALVTEDSLDELDDAEVRILKVPVTSVKNWVKHVKRISEEMSRPSWGVVTLIKLVPDAKTQFKIQFSFESMVEMTQERMEALQRRRGELAKTMMLPYQEPAEEAPPPPRRGKAVTKKAAPPPARKAKTAAIPASAKTKGNGASRRKY